MDHWDLTKGADQNSELKSERVQAISLVAVLRQPAGG